MFWLHNNVVRNSSGLKCVFWSGLLFCCRLTKAAPRRDEAAAVTGLRALLPPPSRLRPAGDAAGVGDEAEPRGSRGFQRVGNGALCTFSCRCEMYQNESCLSRLGPWPKAVVKDTFGGRVLRQCLLTRPTALLLFNFLFGQLYLTANAFSA